MVSATDFCIVYAAPGADARTYPPWRGLVKREKGLARSGEMGEDRKEAAQDVRIVKSALTRVLK